MRSVTPPTRSSLAWLLLAVIVQGSVPSAASRGSRIFGRPPFPPYAPYPPDRPFPPNFPVPANAPLPKDIEAPEVTPYPPYTPLPPYTPDSPYPPDEPLGSPSSPAPSSHDSPPSVPAPSPAPIGKDCVEGTADGEGAGAGAGGDSTGGAGGVDWSVLEGASHGAILSSLRNAALSKPAYASSRLMRVTPASKAVDGFILGVTNATAQPSAVDPATDGYPWFSSDSELGWGDHAGSWWSVDLQDEFFVFFVVLYNIYDQPQAYGAGYLTETEVRVGNTPVSSCDITNTVLRSNALCWKLPSYYPVASTSRVEAYRAQCGSVLAGRWVSVQDQPRAVGYSFRRPFNLLEVEVYGLPASSGPSPPLSSTGSPLPNVALSRPTFASTATSSAPNDTVVRHRSSNAVDGIIPGITPGFPIESPVYDVNAGLDAASLFASQPEEEPWWAVNLQDTTWVHYVLLYTRWDQRGSGYDNQLPAFRKLHGGVVRVGHRPVDTCGAGAEQLARNAVCWRQPEPVRYPGQVVVARCAEPLVGSWVTLSQLATPPPPGFYLPTLNALELLEIEVYGEAETGRRPAASVPSPPAWTDGPPRLDPAAPPPPPPPTPDGIYVYIVTTAPPPPSPPPEPPKPVAATRCNVGIYGQASPTPVVYAAYVQCEGPEAPVSISVGSWLQPYVTLFNGVQLLDPSVPGAGRPGGPNDPWDCGITFHNLTRVELWNSIVQGLWLNAGGPLIHLDGAIDVRFSDVAIRAIGGAPSNDSSSSGTPPPAPPSGPPDYSIFNWRPPNGCSGCTPWDFPFVYGAVLVERAMLVDIEQLGCSHVTGATHWACIWVDVLETLAPPPPPPSPPPQQSYPPSTPSSGPSPPQQPSPPPGSNPYDYSDEPPAPPRDGDYDDYDYDYDYLGGGGYYQYHYYYDQPLTPPPPYGSQPPSYGTQPPQALPPAAPSDLPYPPPPSYASPSPAPPGREPDPAPPNESQVPPPSSPPSMPPQPDIRAFYNALVRSPSAPPRVIMQQSLIGQTEVSVPPGGEGLYINNLDSYGFYTSAARVGASAGRFGAVVLRWLPEELLPAQQATSSVTLRPWCDARDAVETPAPAFQVDSSLLSDNRGVRGGAISLLLAQRVSVYGTNQPLEVMPELSVSRSTLTNNNAVTEGGAIFMSAVRTVSTYNGVRDFAAKVSLQRCLLQGNHAPQGGSDFVAGGDVSQLVTEHSLINTTRLTLQERSIDLRGAFGLVLE